MSLEVAGAMARHGLLRWHLTGVYRGLGWAGRLGGRLVKRFHPDVPIERVRVRSREEVLATLVARTSGSADVARAAPHLAQTADSDAGPATLPHARPWCCTDSRQPRWKRSRSPSRRG